MKQIHLTQNKMDGELFCTSNHYITGPARNSEGEELLRMLDSQKANETEEEE